MPPTIITKESLYKRITALERQHCCNKNQFFDNFAEFPATGNTEVLYTDLSTGNIYIWNGIEYISADTVVVPEARICLNTATPAFTPLDVNNPTTAEVEAYVTANGVDTNGTQVVYFVDGDGGSCDEPDFIWIVNGADVTLSYIVVSNTVQIFPGIYNQNVRFATAIIRPTIQLDGSVTWAFVDDSDHDVVFFDGITTPNSNNIRVSHTASKKVLAFSVSCDETLHIFGVIAGANVGLSYADISLSARYQLRQVITFNGTTWSNSGVIFGNATNSGNQILFTVPSGVFVNAEFTYGNTMAMYAGSNNRILRQVFSGIGYFQTKYELIDPATGNVVSPNSQDSIILFNPNVNVNLNTITTNTNHQLEKHVYDASLLPNLFITAIYIV